MHCSFCGKEFNADDDKDGFSYVFIPKDKNSENGTFGFITCTACGIQLNSIIDACMNGEYKVERSYSTPIYEIER